MELEDGLRTHVCRHTFARCWEVSANASITVEITAVLDGSMLNPRSVDRDPQICITDGRVVNEYHIHDISNYPNFAPCTALSASVPRKILPTGPVPDQFIYIPLREVWSSTAQNGGFVNVATFNNHYMYMCMEWMYVCVTVCSSSVVCWVNSTRK